MQLQMIWPEDRLDAPPAPALADGYNLRTFAPGDAGEYLALMASAGFAVFTAERLENVRKKALERGLFVATRGPNGPLVATAAALHNPSELHPDGGELGWVAALPSESGKGLGKAVCAAATARFIAAGYRRIYLQTDDWRTPALATYLSLGYVPLLCAPHMASRWEEVCGTLERPFAPESWPTE